MPNLNELSGYPAVPTVTGEVFTSAEKTKLGNIETAATADQTDTEIETAYNNRVAIESQANAEAGTSTTAKRWTAERVRQAIVAAPIDVAKLASVPTMTVKTADYTAVLGDFTPVGYKRFKFTTGKIVLNTGLSVPSGYSLIVWNRTGSAMTLNTGTATIEGVVTVAANGAARIESIGTDTFGIW